MAKEGTAAKGGSPAARAVKSVVAGAMVSATAIALGSFVLARFGLDALAGALLSDLFLPVFLCLAVLSAVLLFRRFDR